MRKRVTKLDILNGPIYKQILLFFFPIMLGSFFQQLYNTVDAIVVGNFVGKQALGAVGGTTGTLVNLLINFIVGLIGGATVVVAQGYGARNYKMVKDGVRSGMSLGIILGAFLMIIGIVFTPSLLRLLNVLSDIFPLSSSYMRIYLTGLIPTMIYNVGAGVLRAIGDSKRPLYFLIVSCFVNIVLDILLVAVFKTGVVGAAIATVISQVVACLLVLYVLSFKDNPCYYVLKDFGYDKDILKEIIRIGLPQGLSSVMYSVSNLFIHSKVNIFGTDTVASFAAFGKIDSLFWMISGAYGNSIITIVGQCFGASKYERAKKSCIVATGLYLITSVLITLICCLGGNYLYNLFTNDSEVIRIGMEMLLFIAPWWSSFVFVEIVSCAMRAVGDSFTPTALTAIFICLLRIVWIVCYPSDTVIKALTCYPISWSISSFLFIVIFIKGDWLKKAISRRNNNLIN